MTSHIVKTIFKDAGLAVTISGVGSLFLSAGQSMMGLFPAERGTQNSKKAEKPSNTSRRI